MKRQEVNAFEDAIINRLQREISFLKDVLNMKQKGSANEMTSKVVMLQEENERLKNMVLDKNHI